MVRMGETGFMEWTEHKSLSITNKYIKFDNTIRIFITIDVFALENALIGVRVDLFHAMRVFNKVVETNSFSLAADSLGLPRASVTTTIQALEKHLQVRLLNRTTRKISLTPDGAVYYDRTARILADVADIESSFHDAERGQEVSFVLMCLYRLDV